jgi:DNA-directed RNA polymerase subunit M/transcription elongation factor TFIIS
MTRYGYNYHCVRCNHLIAAANKPLDVPAICSSCDYSDTLKAIARQNEKLSVDEKTKELQKKIDERKARKNDKKK